MKQIIWLLFTIITTNSVFAAQGTLVWTQSGIISQNSCLRSSGANIDIIYPLSTAMPNSPSMLNLRGETNNQQHGPNIQLYTNDSHPIIQLLGNSHDNNGFCFDCYLNSNSTWISSHKSSNFRIYKGNDLLSIDYSSGVDQGNHIAWNKAITIDKNGFVTVNKLAQQHDAPISATIIIATKGALTSQITIDVIRIGKFVTVTVRKLIGKVISPDLIHVDIWNKLDQSFYPQSLSKRDYIVNWPIYVIDNGIKLGMVEFYGTNSTAKFVIYSSFGTNFSVGDNRGWNDFSFSYVVATT